MAGQQVFQRNIFQNNVFQVGASVSNTVSTPSGGLGGGRIPRRRRRKAEDDYPGIDWTREKVLAEWKAERLAEQKARKAKAPARQRAAKAATIPDDELQALILLLAA